MQQPDSAARFLLVPDLGAGATAVEPGPRGEAVHVDCGANPSLVFWKMPVSPWLLNGEEDPSAKQTFLTAFARACEEGALRAEQCAAQVIERRRALLRSLQSDGRCWCTLDRVTEERIAVGTGLPHLYESGLALSLLYGFPIVPASSIRGVVRHHAFQDIAAELGVPRLSYEEWAGRKMDKAGKDAEPSPLERLEALLASPRPEIAEPRRRKEALQRLECRFAELVADLRRIGNQAAPVCSLAAENVLHSDRVRSFHSAFGTAGWRGRAVFFDGIFRRCTYEMDVVTPHHTPYYEGDEPPADWYTPRPHTFLVIKRGAEISFTLAVSPPRRSCEPTAPDLLDSVTRWTLGAVTTSGIGAKTRLGYGTVRGV